jgi:prepilin-type N-terminal cleavage/methylation domain-containing protein
MPVTLTSAMALPLLAWLVVMRRGTAAAMPPAPQQGGRGSRSAGPVGFTLVEMLVVILVVAVILAVAIPALGHWRRTGRDSATLSLARQHALNLTAYANEFKEVAPYFTVPLPGEVSPIALHDGTTIKVFYFGAYYTWSHVLGPRYYRTPGIGPEFVSPWSRDTWRGAFDYLYPCTFIAHPDYWNYATRTIPPEQLTPTRLGDVAHPSAKAFVVDDAMWQSDRAMHAGERRTAAGCVDGSGVLLRAGLCAPQYRVGDGAAPPFRDYTRHFASYNPLLHTEGGVRARDFVRP